MLTPSDLDQIKADIAKIHKTTEVIKNNTSRGTDAPLYYLRQLTESVADLATIVETLARRGGHH